MQGLACERAEPNRGHGKKLADDWHRRFAIRLANQLGWLDVDEMLANMSPEQWRERVAHYEIEPWGDDWQRTATIAKGLADLTNTNIVLHAKKDIPSYRWAKIIDFIPLPNWFREKLIREEKRK